MKVQRLLHRASLVATLVFSGCSLSRTRRTLEDTQLAPPDCSAQQRGDRLARESHGVSDLVQAIRQGELDAVESLVSNGVDVNTLWEEDVIFETHVLSPLIAAIRARERDIARWLVAHGADIDASGATSCPAVEAVKAGDVGSLILLLDRGLSKDSRGRALRRAAREGRRDIVELLIDRGTDVDAGRRNGEPTALFYACYDCHLDLVPELIDRGADVNAVSSLGTPLHGAAGWGCVSATQQLLLSGANPNMRDASGATPLLRALQRGDQGAATVGILLTWGADASLTDRTGWSAFHAFAHGFWSGPPPPVGRLERVARLLVVSGADVNARDDRGCTPCHLACAGGNQRVLIALLRNGAVAGEKDVDGHTPLDLARENRHPDIVDLLQARDRDDMREHNGNE